MESTVDALVRAGVMAVCERIGGRYRARDRICVNSSKGFREHLCLSAFFVHTLELTGCRDHSPSFASSCVHPSIHPLFPPSLHPSIPCSFHPSLPSLLSPFIHPPIPCSLHPSLPHPPSLPPFVYPELYLPAIILLSVSYLHCF